ncbi:MAG: DNA polymerase III subunit delta [Candidatus Kerfeldbacteria bacterium]
MVIFLYGNDSFRIAERLAFLRDAFKKKFDETGMNIAEIDGVKFEIDEFRKHAKSVGLFSQKRFVAVRDVWSLNKEQQNELMDELAGIDEDTILCITCDDPPRKDNKLFKRLLKADTVEEYAELNDGQLRAFIQKKCKSSGATIEPRALEHLASAIGNDLWRMNNEIKKLSGQSSTITEQMVEASVDKALDENIFHLTDALGARNAKLASSLLEQQFELGANEQYLITMLARQIAILLKVKQTNGKGLKLHPFVIKKSLVQSQQFEEQRLLDLYWRLLEIDEELKTTTTNAKALLDVFVLDACK